MAPRIAKPLSDRRVQMRTAVQRNEPGFVDLLLDNRYVTRRLNDFIVVVVACRDAWQRGSYDTTRVERKLFGPVINFLARRAFIRSIDTVQFGLSFLSFR